MPSNDGTFSNRNFASSFGCNYIPRRRRVGRWPEYDHPIWYIYDAVDEEAYAGAQRAFRRAKRRRNFHSNYNDHRSIVTLLRSHPKMPYKFGLILMRQTDFVEMFGERLPLKTEVDFLEWAKSQW